MNMPHRQTILASPAGLLGIALIGLAIGLLPQASCLTVKLIDKQETVDVETVVQALCEASNDIGSQISRISTVSKLADYFRSQVTSEEHKWARCKGQHEDALVALQEVITVTPENVCSETKLASIEDFHNRFVSTQVEHMSNRQDANREAAPTLLRLFFLHYVLEVDAICKRNLINNLEWDLKEKFGVDISETLFGLDEQTDGNDRQAFSALFKGAMGKFTELYSVQKYEDVLMIWDLIENSYLNQKMESEGDIVDDLDPRTGEPVRLLVKIRSTKYLHKIQELCHYKFKPIYRKLILPIIKLADLGYSNSGEQFKRELDELRSNENVKRWYGITQLCEALLPVRFFEEPTMESNEVVVITKQEAKEREMAASDQLERIETAYEYEPVTNSMAGVDQLDSVGTIEAQNLVKQIKLNLSVRDRIIGRAVVKLLRNLKTQLTNTRVGRFFFSKKSQKLANPKSGEKETHYVKEEIGAQFSRTIENVNEEDLLKMEGAATRRPLRSEVNNRGVGRRRRYHRKGDVDIVQEARAEALSYKRTKSWSEIFSGWGEVLMTLAPSRTKLIIVGCILVGLLFMIMMVCVLGAFVASGSMAG